MSTRLRVLEPASRAAERASGGRFHCPSARVRYALSWPTYVTPPRIKTTCQLGLLGCKQGTWNNTTVHSLSSGVTNGTAHNLFCSFAPVESTGLVSVSNVLGIECVELDALRHFLTLIWVKCSNTYTWKDTASPNQSRSARVNISSD